MKYGREVRKELRRTQSREQDSEMEIRKGEKFRRMPVNYRESKMRERLEIEKEIWKRHSDFREG